MRVAVVGAGIMGASAARFLARRGHAVVVFEQFELGHAMGSSHGRSRIVRMAYPDPFYAEVMLEAYPMWAELEAESGDAILDPCGLVYFGPDSSADLKSTVSGLQALAIPFEVLDAEQVHRVFRALRLGSDEVGIWTQDGGWVHAERAVRASLRLATCAGAQVIRERVRSLEGIERDYDAVVLCTGAWTQQFVALDVEVQERTFAYIGGNVEGPVWIEDGPGLHYGFPTEPDAASFKIGGHVCGEPFDPDRTDRPVRPANLEAIRDVARRRFGIEDPEVVSSSLCLYTRTEAEDFRIGRASRKTVYASACSGHGFKFGPWIGRYLADLVDERRQPDEFPRWNVRTA